MLNIYLTEAEAVTNDVLLELSTWWYGYLTQKRVILEQNSLYVNMMQDFLCKYSE